MESSVPVDPNAPDATPGIAKASLTLYERPDGTLAVELLTAGEPNMEDRCHRVMQIIAENLPLVFQMAGIAPQENYSVDPLPTHQAAESIQ